MLLERVSYPHPYLTLNPKILIVILTITLTLACTRQVRDVTMSKRGQAHKVEEKFIARCNQDGMTPVQSEHRVNLRTMSATSKERLEMRVEERHGWALRSSRHEVEVLKEQLLDEEYVHFLEKEAADMRVRVQLQKQKDALTHAGVKAGNLELLLVAADQSRKEVERRLRKESTEADKALRRVKQLERAEDNLLTGCNDKYRELEATHAQKKQSEKEVRRQWKEAEKELSRLQSELKRKCEELEVQKKQSEKELRRKWTDAEKELGRLRSELKLKCEELQEQKKHSDIEVRRKWTEAVRAKTTFDELSQERDDLVEVRHCPFLFHNVICVAVYLFLLLHHDSLGTQEAKKRTREHK